jgi:hypothetical protein
MFVNALEHFLRNNAALGQMPPVPVDAFDGFRPLPSAQLVPEALRDWQMPSIAVRG